MSPALWGVVFAAGRSLPSIPARRWPVLGGQGALDATGYLALLAGSGGVGGTITIVVSSAFSRVTVALARVPRAQATT